MKRTRFSGYTLIELVIGIITFSVVLTIVTDLLAPQANRSVDPIFQVRATELAQSLFNEMSGKLFDENADRSGGRIRCNEDLDADGLATNVSIGERACTLPTLLGPEDGLGGRPNGNENDREVYDDIDDYHGLQFTDGSQFQNSLGEQLVIDGSNLYEGFQMEVAVVYDADQDGGADTLSGNVKRIDVVVTTPNGEEIFFSVFKHNY